MLTVVFVSAAVLGGCGEEPAPSSGASSGSGSASQPSADEAKPGVSPSEPSDGSPEPSEPQTDAVTVEISIEGGDVDPAGKQVEATVGQTVVLVVDSDAAEELHVHSAPDEHEFAIEPGQSRRFRFTVEQPGQFDVEAHETGVLVAQLVVRP